MSELVSEVATQIRRGLQDGIHPGDLLELLDQLGDGEKEELLELLSDSEATALIQEMEPFEQVSLFRLLSRERAPAILKEMASDDAVDLLGELSPKEIAELLPLVDEDTAKFSGLLKYPEESAGGIMTTEYISLPADLPVEEAIARLREIAPQAETIYYVFVVDVENRLIGVLSLRDLIAAPDGTPLKEIMKHNVISVNALLDQEEAARVVAKYDLLAVPVVDDDNRLLGIITFDDIMDVLEQEATEDIYRLAGAGEVTGVELMEASIYKIAWHRTPWLLLSMLGGILAGYIMSAFESTLEAILVLAFFIPVIMDMGGNVSTQTSTIFVRGIATGEIRGADFWRYFIREVRVGLFMGVLFGILVAVTAVLWRGSPILGLVVGISMVATVSLATVIGTLVPLLFHKLHIDPAITSGPLVTTIKDVTGLLIYFGMATLFLDYLQ
ncbi:MAG: magnesium transporter [Dethiobacteria bacterium]|nr:magnesium transporter [Bacillota bacterium]NMD33114.1 magnesium transporter [Bacillota bacterium]